MKKWLVAFLAVCFASVGALAQENVIKMATSAPEGSPTLKVLRKLNDELKTATGGKLSFKFFAGGVLGDDKVMLDKMKYGQIQAAALTGVGLGEIASEVRLLEMPFHFGSYKQIDCVVNAFSDEFAKKFEEKGYVLLGWADQGFVYLFSKKRIEKVADMAGTKPWVWGSDVLAKAIFNAFDLNPVPLELQDVFTSLQTGLIDTVYISPVYAVGMQWYTKVQYMVDVPITDGIGAMVISKKAFDALPADQQVVLKTKATEYLKKLTAVTRQGNDKAIKVLADKGIQVIKVDASQTSQFRSKGEQAAKALVGKLYSAEMLKRLQAQISKCGR